MSVKEILKDVYNLKKKISNKYGSSSIENIAEQSLSVLEKALIEQLMDFQFPLWDTTRRPNCNYV